MEADLSEDESSSTEEYDSVRFTFVDGDAIYCHVVSNENLKHLYSENTNCDAPTLLKVLNTDACVVAFRRDRLSATVRWVVLGPNYNGYIDVVMPRIVTSEQDAPAEHKDPAVCDSRMAALEADVRALRAAVALLAAHVRHLDNKFTVQFRQRLVKQSLR
jgi:hypothetical protein